MKKRILEITDSDGNTAFYPQRKVLFLWWYYDDAYYGGPIGFESLGKARAWVNYDPRHVVIVHNA